MQIFNDGIVVSDICGGLGNAMFMYIVGKSVANRYNMEFKYDISEPRKDYLEWYKQFWFLTKEEKFQLEPTNFFKIYENQIRNVLIDFEKFLTHGHFDYWYLKGYWQNDDFFDAELCQKVFGITDDCKKRILDKYGDFSDRVHVCVRRGDFIQLNWSMDFQWYDNVLKKYFPGRKLVINSDDIEWCKDKFKQYDAIYIDNSDVVETMYAGTLCKDHVIADSSFAWWQAYLSDYNQVVCPDGWSAAVRKWKTEPKILG